MHGHTIDTLEIKTMPVTKPKRVNFTSMTVYYFGVAIGGSSLPFESGPAIGLDKKHVHKEVLLFDNTKRCRRGRVRKYGHHERINMLKAAGHAVRDIAEYCSDAIDIRQSRAATRYEVRQKKRRNDVLRNDSRKRSRGMITSSRISMSDEMDSDEDEI